MLYSIYILLTINCLVEKVNCYTSYSRSINLKPGDGAIIESVNYPNNSPANLRQSWMFTTSPEAVIRLTCHDVRLLQDKPCRNDALIISDQKKTDVICGATFNYFYESEEHQLALSLRIGPKAIGKIQCRATAEWRVQEETTTENNFAFLDFESEEIDSSEHGGPRGRKQTTCDCGWTNKKYGRIFGGTETHINEFPFVAGLLPTGRTQTFCGATIITPYHAITAAHCLYNMSSHGPFSIVVGEHDLETTTDTTVTEYIQIKKYILHEQYDPQTMLHDIAFLLLEKKINFSKFVGPACLPNGPINLENEIIKVIGWGRTPSKPYGSPVLQKVNLKVLTKSACAALRPSQIPAGSPNQICTYGEGKSACFGDSGGPLVWVDPETNRFTLVGVVSYGRKDCSQPFPRVAIDVMSYMDWILLQIRENGVDSSICTKSQS